MRDGIAIARKGLPAVAFVTTDFWPQGDFVAKSEGMPNIPRIKLPHPVAGTGIKAIHAVAAAIAEEVQARLRGS